MRSRICGAEWTLPSSTMARRLPTLASVSSEKARAPAGVEVHRDVGLAGVLVDRDARGGHVAPGDRRLLLDEERHLPLLAGLLVHPALVEDLGARRRPGPQRGLRVGALVHHLELEQRGLADEGLGARRILHARELHQDAVLALLLDGRLGDAELVDAVADGLEPLAHRQIADVLGLARLERQHHAAGGLIGFLPVEGGQDLVGRLHRRVPALRRGELEDELGGAAPLDPRDADAALLQLGLRGVPRPLDLGFEGLVHVHPEDQMDAPLEVQAQVDRLGGRVQVPDRHRDDDDDESDADSELTAHPRRSTPCRPRRARCARWRPARSRASPDRPP